MSEPPFTPGNGAIYPVHNWVLNIAGRPFGINQWGDCDCSIYVGTRVATIQVPAMVVVLTVLAFMLLIVLIWARTSRGPRMKDGSLL